MSALFTQCLGDTVQIGTGKVDPARKFKCTTAAGETIVWAQELTAGLLLLNLISLQQDCRFLMGQGVSDY